MIKGNKFVKTYKVTIDIENTIRWYNEKGQLHREDDPAVEYVNGSKYWHLNGQLHRENGPAVECYNGKWWYLNHKKFTKEEFDKEISKRKNSC